MQTLLSETWRLLLRNNILLTVIIFETLILLFFRGGQLAFGLNPLMEMALYFFHLAVLAGWLYQMKHIIVRPEERVGFGHFLDGVARYFQPMMAGGALFVLICILGFMLAIGLASLLIGAPDETLLTKISELIQQEKFTEIEPLLQASPEATQQLLSWAMSFLGGLTLLGLYLATLFFWTQWIVLADMRWPQAWRRSQVIMFKQWKALIWLSLVWLIPHLFIYGGLFSGNTVVTVIAFFLLLLAKAYFALLFMRFLALAEPENVTPLEPSSPKTGQA